MNIVTNSIVILKLSLKFPDWAVESKQLLPSPSPPDLVLLYVVKEVLWAGDMDWSSSGREQVVGCCEEGNEHLCSINCGEFLDWLRKC